jgi:hypothetical protein
LRLGDAGKKCCPKSNAGDEHSTLGSMPLYQLKGTASRPQYDEERLEPLPISTTFAGESDSSPEWQRANEPLIRNAFADRSHSAEEERRPDYQRYYGQAQPTAAVEYSGNQGYGSGTASLSAVVNQQQLVNRPYMAEYEAYSYYAYHQQYPLMEPSWQPQQSVWTQQHHFAELARHHHHYSQPQPVFQPFPQPTMPQYGNHRFVASEPHYHYYSGLSDAYFGSYVAPSIREPLRQNPSGPPKKTSFKYKCFKAKEKKRKRDENEPKRALTAYNLFFKHHRALMLGEKLPITRQGAEQGECTHGEDACGVDPEHNTSNDSPQVEKPPHRKKVGFAEMARRVSKSWQEASDEEKLKFRKLADQDRVRYEKEKAAYDATKEKSDPEKPDKS